MINIYSNFQYVNDLISKNNGSYLSPEEYSRYAQVASSELFSTLIGEKNQNVTVYGRNRTLDNRLRVFRERVSLVFTGGLAVIPTGCRLVRSIITDTGLKVKPLDEDREAEVQKDPLAKPDGKDIYYATDALQFRLIGESGSLPTKLEYLREPAKPVFGYTTTNGGRTIVYDPTTSTNFDWDISMEHELTTRILAQLGLSMSNGTVIQVANNNLTKE